jgi:energy-coupling factor transporter ATP-binding protein EcfA2
MNEMKNRKEFIEHFGFKVVPCGRDKKPYGKWSKAEVNPDIDTDCYACFAGGTRYGAGVIVVIDLDNHFHKEGETGRNFWNKQLLDDETFTVRTPSGGEHLYFLATEEQITQLKEIAPTRNRLAEQVEIFWNGKHLSNGAFGKTDVGEYRIEKCVDLYPLPERVIDLFRNYNAGKRASVPLSRKMTDMEEMEQKVVLCELDTLADDGEFEDYETWIELMLAMRNAGFSVEEAETVSWDNEKTKQKIESIWKEPRIAAENEIGLGSIIYRWVPRFPDKQWRAGKLEEIVIQETINRFNFLKKIKLGASTGILDMSGANKILVKDYKNTLACYQSKEYRMRYPRYDENKRNITWKDVNGFDVWWKEAEALEGFKTFPYKPMGEIEEDGYRWFNDWEESPIKDGEGTPELFYEHLLENVCDGNETVFNYLKHWIWDLIANPQHKNNIAIAITGKQGCGKSSVFKVLQKCFHPKYTATIDNTEQLLNKFDADWKSSVLVAVEEACFAGDRKSGVWGKVKSLITDDETSIERKNYDRYKTASMLHFIITGNDTHIVPKERGDRRYLVLECNDNRVQDVDFFSRMFDDMENGGVKKLIDEAQKHAEEARRFPFHKIPITTIGVQNVRESADFVLQWLMEQIENYAGDDDSIFIRLSNGDIAIRTRDISYQMREDGNTNKFSSITLGKKLKAYFGVEPKQIKIDGKNFNGFRFSGFDEIRKRIRDNYFDGENPFATDTPQFEEAETEMGEMLSQLENPAS